MSKSSIVVVILAFSSLLGCEREVVGETFAGQKSGGRSLHVTGAAPPRGATSTPSDLTAPPELVGRRVPASDPAIRGQLLASGANTTARRRGGALPGRGLRVPGLPGMPSNFGPGVPRP